MAGMSAPWLRPAVMAALLAAAPAAHAARDVMLVLDNSGSMRRNDPARLAAPAVARFISSQPRDTRVGILLFDASPQLALPLMPAEVAADGEAQKALARFDYRGQWTHTAGAVERALYELRTEGRRDAARAVVLMTDGLLDTGEPARDAELNRWLRQELATDARRDDVRIFGIAFTEQADYQLLQSLAAGTGGEYFRVLEAAGIARALHGIEEVLVAGADAAPAAGAPGAAAQGEVLAPPRAADAVAGEPAAEGPTGFPVWAALASALGTALMAILAWAWLNRDRGAPGEGRGRGPTAVLFDSHERHEIGGRPVVIGRTAGNDPSRYYIVLPEKTVGRWHATIERRGQTFWLRDEGSVNGTFVNGERVTGERPLKHRDTLRIHTHAFEFEIPELADADRTMLTSAKRLSA
jgi:Mg-chelatase subunit ChlD